MERMAKMTKFWHGVGWLLLYFSLSVVLVGLFVAIMALGFVLAGGVH
jgi:hypothetical protein